jgi:protein-tyrosine phosphatase
MNPKLYWIKSSLPGKLAISARPRGGEWLEDEIAGWRTAGIDAVVSLLTPQENQDLQLVAESKLAQSRGVLFMSLPVEDRGVPASWKEASDAVAEIGEILRQGRNVAVHCRQGIGRSGMIAAAVLVKNGSTSDDAMKLISEVRGLPVPETPEQREWVRKFSTQDVPSAIALTRASVK